MVVLAKEVQSMIKGKPLLLLLLVPFFHPLCIPGGEKKVFPANGVLWEAQSMYSIVGLDFSALLLPNCGQGQPG